MTKQHTPQDTVAAVLANPMLPPGDDERFVGFGIMGLPFANGHYLAMRQFPRRPSRPRTCRCGIATRRVTGRSTRRRPGSRAALVTSARPPLTTRFSAISTVSWARPVVRRRRNPRNAATGQFDLQATRATRLMSTIGSRLSESAWCDPTTCGG